MTLRLNHFLPAKSGRRSPPALGLAIALRDAGNGLAVRCHGKFVVYTRHFPDYAGATC